MNKKLIVISAVWCPSCLILKKHLKIIKNEYNLDYEILDFDLDEDEVNKYNIGDKLPVIICNNQRIIGEQSYEELVTFLKQCEII